MVGELKSWCLSKLHLMELRLGGDQRPWTPLRRSTSLTEGLTPTPTPTPGPREPEDTGAGGAPSHYFVVHADSSPGIRRPGSR